MHYPLRLPLLALWCVGLYGCGGSSNSEPSPMPPVDATPLAQADVANADNGNAVTLAVLANDSSPVGAVLRVTGFTNPTHGVVTLVNGALNYQPEAGFFGRDEFTYTLTDSANRTASAQVAIISRIKLQLRGGVERQVVGAQIRLDPGDSVASTSSVGGLYSIELSTSNADAIVRLEAQGSGQDAFTHFAVLLGSARELLARAKALDAVERGLGSDAVPRLRLGVLGTAEYGMLRELASAEDLSNPLKLQRLRAFVDGEALLERAVLLNRALDTPTARTVASTLLLASDPLALSALRNPIGSVGSGGVANESQLALAKGVLRSDSGYYSSTHILSEGPSWISSDPQNRSSRMLLVNRWTGDRLDNHEQLRNGFGGAGLQRLSLSTAVQVTRSEQQVVLSASDVRGLGSHSECNGQIADCEVLSRTTSLTLRPFFDHYLRVSADAIFADETTARLLSDQLATLAPGYARNQPEQVLLSLCNRCSDSSESWVTDRVQFTADGRYSQILEGHPASLTPVSGNWTPRPNRGPLLLDRAGADQHEVDWVAESAGRSLAIITSHNASGGTRVVLSEWAELPASNPALPATFSRCDPVVDGYLLGRSLSGTSVPGERLLLLPNGRFVRSFDPAVDAQASGQGDWSLQPEALNFSMPPFSQWRFLPRQQLPNNHWLLLETRQFARMGISAEPVEFARLSVPRLYRCE